MLAHRKIHHKTHQLRRCCCSGRQHLANQRNLSRCFEYFFEYAIFFFEYRIIVLVIKIMMVLMTIIVVIRRLTCELPLQWSLGIYARHERTFTLTSHLSMMMVAVMMLC